jgi:hypothetical protein
METTTAHFIVGDLFTPEKKVKKSKGQQIFQYLLRGQTLTHRECQEKFDHDRLSARIDEMRKKGHIIRTIMEANGQGGRHARYRLVEAARNSYGNPIMP